MKGKSKRFFAVIILAIFIFSVGFLYGKSRANDDLEKKLEVFLQVLSVIKTQYVEKDVDNTKLVYGAIRGMLTSLDDPYSRFLEPTAYSEMRMRMKGSYSGIGIYIGMKEHQLIVISPIAGTPAEEKGLKPKDLIVKIDDKPTKDMALEEAVSLIRGKKGTRVKLSVMRKGFDEPKDFVIKRSEILIKSVEFKMMQDDIAYIKLNTFEKQGAPAEFKKAINSVKKDNAKGLILDLRGNGGGLLENAIEIGSMFIRSGAIVQTVDRNGMNEIQYSTGDVIWVNPIVVLIDESSASASEILAGALQDNKIATIVGTNSFGKASVQSVRMLQDNSAILLTIAKYLTPSGKDITKKGIIPDVEIKLPTEEAKLKLLEETGSDLQLDKAVKVLKGLI
ncbi:hypothetical protein A2526_02630 [candidate division WOR-1 bacterium RIFOXYD2_FULL_36_8]|uniref:PDZ domain-containing protein n=1 Tax=candidate division WOR-1 bacterium RIFOXYB2_FULL_36_35 TaxID=1802578 RepID=A0A1F4S3M0_UNCSA|nr:MAG: hypothetical protein A2230_08945 [candidate division WOR-1 bacterium RIFOXYA2_FULL_36_21]OGC14999.1 MAG: hypothetical protein A2290_01585 [candidate division WOR-1 bacterium RIFOXYB2_FULL_36_35]OGC18706.1 MAG: hypothetical protein A2282_07365 [candidate division WOR-1 bacterium RIFOXYA12_FULL_36_13]OGC38689.1 MAG: hypothetical protein A2526_02630 [candidate division WOR-1 bacterium RIFOXYD2_FULL_36_8]